MKKSIAYIVVLFLWCSGIAQASLTDGLVAYYPFDGNAYDASGYGNNGIDVGVIPTSDRFGMDSSAYYFDGNGYIDVNNNPQINLNIHITVSAWVKITSFNNENCAFNAILIKGPDATMGSYGLGIGNDPDTCLPQINHRFRFFIRLPDKPYGYVPSFILSNTIVSLNNWYHVVGTYDGNTMNMYLNGILESSLTVSQTLTENNEKMTIGYHNATNPMPVFKYMFHGSIDDVRIYNRDLKSAEVLALYYYGTMPTDIVNQLISTITGLFLPTDMENSYFANLKKVNPFISENKLKPALNQLSTFIHKVNQDLRQDKISQANGNMLINMANAVLILLTP